MLLWPRPQRAPPKVSRISSGISTSISKNILRPSRPDQSNGTLLFRVALLHAQRFPRAFILGFGYAEGIFTWLAMSCRISDAGYLASYIDQSQSDGTSNGRVGASPRSKQISARVETEGFDYWTIDDDQRGRSVCRRLHAVESEIFVQEPFNGSKDQGKVFRVHTRP